MRILHVDDDEEDFIIMRDMLATLDNISPTIDWVDTYDTAIAILIRNEHDICLLDYYLGEHNGLELMNQAQEEGCTVPFVMLTGSSNQDVDAKALQSGIYHYIEKNRLDADHIERTIRYSLEHSRLLRKVQELNDTLEQRVINRTALLIQAKEQLETEIAEREKVEAELQKLRIERVQRTLENIAHPTGSIVTSRLLGIYPLQESEPDTFDRLVKSYEELLDLALERRAFWIEDNKLSDEIRNMADTMGALRLSPRDIVEVYNTALKSRNSNIELTQKAEAYIEEGRLTLLELMGYLVSYYRNYVSGG